VGLTKFLKKGGEKDEKNQNQAFLQKGCGGKKSEPSQADEEVNRPYENRWYPKNFCDTILNSWDAS
jgi:hypothetical protein